MYKKGDKTDRSNYSGISRLSTRYKMLSIICCLSSTVLLVQRKLLRIINVHIDTKYQLLIIYSAFIKYLRNNGLQGSSASATYKLQEG